MSVEEVDHSTEISLMDAVKVEGYEEIKPL